jgi:hypothetical protein
MLAEGEGAEEILLAVGLEARGGLGAEAEAVTLMAILG